MSFICRYQIVLDVTSITVHKPTLWAIRISQVTPLNASQSKMRRIKTQLAFVRCPLYTQTHIFHILLYKVKHQVKTSSLLVLCHHLAFWVENPLTPDKTKFLQCTGV